MHHNSLKTNHVPLARFLLSDWGGRLTLGIVLFTSCYVVWVLSVTAGTTLPTLVTDIAQPLITLTMTILAWRASRQPSLDIRSRRAWKVLAIAFLFYSLGNIFWAYFEIWKGEDLAVSLADLPYLIYYPLALIGLLCFPLARQGKSRLTFALDAGTVMVGAATVIWYLVLRAVAQADHATSLEAAVTLAYPVCNTVFLFGVIAISLSRPSRALRLPLAILMIAIFCDAIADFGYSYQILQNSYTGGGWPDCFYMVGFSLMALSAQIQVFTARQTQESRPTSSTEAYPFRWLPYFAVMLAYGLLVVVTVKHSQTHGDEPILWLVLAAVGITVLVVMRQIVAVRENSRLLAENAARQNEARFLSLMKHSQDAISIMELSGKLSYLSPAVGAIFGYSDDELLGTNLLKRIHPDDKSGTIAAISSACTEPGGSAFVEARARHRDGHWLDIEAMITNLIDDPQVGGILINSRNVTERKKALDTLEETEEQLRQSQKMDAVGQLAGGVAHDFNNLLAVITGYTELLIQRSDGFDKRAMQHLEQIGKAANRAASLTRQLLAFSRKQVLQPKILDLNAVVGDVQKMLVRLIGEHIDLTTSLDPNLWRIKADPGQVEQVLMNLAVNARDAMPLGGKLTIETSNVFLDAASTQKSRTIYPGPHVLITVTDTGEGMSTEVQARIFEPFYTTKEQGKGTGLGLSTVYGIVKQSGGMIWVSSDEGFGTTFKIYLPQAKDVADHPEPEHLQLRDPVGTGTILLVEDEESVRAMAQEILKHSGYNVIEASNGGEALELVADRIGSIDLILTDIVMPYMGGRELAEKLLALRPSLRILYMSGYTDDAIVHHGVTGHENCFLQKPFTPLGLTQKISEVLSAA